MTIVDLKPKSPKTKIEKTKESKVEPKEEPKNKEEIINNEDVKTLTSNLLDILPEDIIKEIITHIDDKTITSLITTTAKADLL